MYNRQEGLCWTRINLRLIRGTVSYRLKENHTPNTCAGLKRDSEKCKKLPARSAPTHLFCSLRFSKDSCPSKAGGILPQLVPSQERDSVARDSVIYCTQRTNVRAGRLLAALKQLLQDLGWLLFFSLVHHVAKLLCWPNSARWQKCSVEQQKAFGLN